MITHWVETRGTRNIDFVINTGELDCIITFIDIILQYLSARTEESHETVRTASVRLWYELATTETQVATVAPWVKLPHSGHCYLWSYLKQIVTRLI